MYRLVPKYFVKTCSSRIAAYTIRIRIVAAAHAAP